MDKVELISEIGINFAYGNNKEQFLDNAKRLIRLSSVAGIPYIKLQKRNPDISVPEHKKESKKIVPWNDNPITYLQYKKDIEFDWKEYIELSMYTKKQGSDLFASVWDMDSAYFMTEFSDIVKIPSAKITDLEMLDYCRNEYSFKIMSTGMSTEEEIDKAVSVLKPDVIMHTNSVYPTPIKDLKLGYLKWLKEKYGTTIEIGYSNHCFSTKVMYVAIGMGATWIEAHFTENHNLWGSDQAASIEPNGMFEITKAISDYGQVIHDGYGPRELFSGEEKKKESLRG